jgi:PAS domain S-box-containing protein
LDPRIDRHPHPVTPPEAHRDSSASSSPGRLAAGRPEGASPAPPRPQLEQLNRALVVLSACNKAVATATSEAELLERACEAIVRVGGYRLSWVGYAEHDEDKRVRPVAQFGFDEGYVERVRITWGDDERGHGPTGTAIRTGRPEVAQRIGTDPRFEPWRADALERGYGSTISLPLVVEGERLGALVIYAAEPDAFDDGEALMLMQAADDLALGIAHQRADAGRREAETEQEKTAAALRVQTALLDQLFESAPEAIVMLDMEDRITRANREFMRMFGYTAAECCGQLLNDLIVPPGMMEHALRLTHEVVECGRQCIAEGVRRRKDGSTMHVSILGSPINSGEKQIAAYAIYRDISERRRMEQMQARRVRYAALRADIQSVFSHAPEGGRDALPCAAEALAQHLDGALARIWTLEGGTQALQLCASAGVDIQPGCPASSHVEADSTLIATVARERVAYVTNDVPADTWPADSGRAGSEGMATFAAYPLLVDDSLAGVLAVRARDPLESDTLETLESVAGMIAQGIARLRAQDALRASEERFRAIVDQQTDLICRFRPDTILTFVNDAYARHFGRTPEELLGRSFLDLIPVEQHEFVRANVHSRCVNPRVEAYEHAAIAADGKLRWHQWIDLLVSDPHGNGVEFQSVGRDVTERHQAEEAIQRSEQIARAQTAIITATLQSMTREPTPDSFTGQVLRTIVEQLGGFAGTFWVPADAPGSVRVYLDLEDDRLVKAEDSGHPGRSPQRIIDLQRPPPAQIDDPKVFDFNHILNHPDYAPFREWALRRGVRTVLQVPMVFGSDIVGVYTVRFDHERTFDAQDLQLAKALALQATLAIRLTQLGEQAKSAAVAQERERAARERAAELNRTNAALQRTLARLVTAEAPSRLLENILQEAAAIVGAGMACIFQYVEDGDALRPRWCVLDAQALDLERDPRFTAWATPVPAAGSRAWRRVVGSSAHAWFLCGNDSDPILPYAPDWQRLMLHRSILAVPLLAGERALGFVAFFLDHSEHPQQQHIELARVFGHQAGLALQLARLGERAQQAAVSQERVAQLAQANQALTGTLERLATEPSLDTALGHVLAAVTHQLEAHSSTLWLYDMAEGLAHLHMVYEHQRIVPAAQSEHPHAQRSISLSAGMHQRNVLDRDLTLTEVSRENGFLPEMCEYLHAQGIRYLLSVPMRLGATVVGACFVRVYRDHLPNPERVELARVLTQQATLLLYASRMAELGKRAALGFEREKAAQERALELAHVNATLQEALELLASEPVLDGFLAYLLQRVVEQFAAHSCSLLLPDEARKEVVVHLTCQDGRIYDREAFSALPIGKAFDGDAEAEKKWSLFQNPQTAVVPDIEAFDFPDSVRAALRVTGIRSLTATPLRLGERVIGRLVVRFDAARALSAPQIELLQSIANQMAVALHMSRLAEEVRRAAVLDERNRMARDIHDTLAQGFTGVIVQLEAAKDAIARRRGRDTREHIQRAADLARHSLAEARRSVRALKPLALEHGGLQAAFEALLANVTAGTGLTAQFASSGEPYGLPLDLEESLLRIGQEALTNVLKHSQAQHFGATLTFDAAAVELVLDDDGVGFDPNARTDGMGLRGMHERAQRLGGQIQLHAAPGNGTHILVRVPRPA